MKKLKKSKAKLPKEEQIVGKGVPREMLNQSHVKKLGKMKSKTSKKRNK